MSEGTIAVLDASVGVKWFKGGEAGAGDALALLQAHARRDLRIVVPAHFIAEVVGTAVRYGGAARGREIWGLLQDADLTVVGLDDMVADAVFEQCRILGCSFYDALAPALSTLLGATLCSADADAHARFEGVKLLG